MKKIVAILMFGVALVWANNLARAEEEAKQMQKCEANDAEACFKLEKFEKACDLGLAKACMIAAGVPYFNNAGKLVEAMNDKEKQLSYYTKACDLGDMGGCEGMLFHMDSKSEETRELYKKYCLNDAVESICFQGFERKYGGTFGDELKQKYLEIRSKKCDEDEVEECAKLGEAYLSGSLYGKGLLYSFNVRLDKNPTKAREFLQKACDTGDTNTCKKYELTQDTSKFKAILQKACDAGNQNACPRLGELYAEEAKNIGKDKGKELYQKACDLGNADGCYELAVSYNIGRGVSQDINKAKELYKKACDLEKSSACENFKRLSK